MKWPKNWKGIFREKCLRIWSYYKRFPGVGRKTANVVMAVAFHKPAMPVDTHVFRVSNQMGW